MLSTSKLYHDIMVPYKFFGGFMWGLHVSSVSNKNKLPAGKAGVINAFDDAKYCSGNCSVLLFKLFASA